MLSGAPRCSTKLSIGPILCRTGDMRHLGMICGVTTASGWQLLVYLCMDMGTMARSPCGFRPRLNGSRPTDTRHNSGLVYST